MIHLTRSILIVGALAFLLCGCRDRVLRWSCYNPDQLKAAKSIVLMDKPISKSGMPYPALISEVASQLIVQGWRVMILPEEMQLIESSLIPAATAETKETSPKRRQKQRYFIVPNDNLTRANKAGAELLAELTVHAIFDVNLRTDSSPYWTFGVYRGYRYGLWGVDGGPYPLLEGSNEMDISWYWKLRSLSLRLSDVKDGTVLAVISVHYREDKDRFDEAAKDLLMGIEAIRKGQSSGEVKLNTKPGQWPKPKQK